MSTSQALKKRNIYTTINLILSFYSVLIIPDILKDYSEAYSFSNSIFSLIVFIGCFSLLQNTVKHITKRSLIISLILGLIFSIFMVLGKNIYTINGAYCFAFITWIQIIGITPIFAALVNLCFRYLLNASQQLSLSRYKKRLPTATVFLITWLLIFLSWIPSLLASYPGVYGYDCIGQINYYRENFFSMGHPIVHTYLLGFCVITLGELLGSYEAGMCCYSIFQMLCLSATFSAMYSLYIAKRLPKALRIFVLLLFMFLPTNPLMAFAGTKDVLFAALFALNVMILLLITENPSLFKSPKYIILFILTSFLMTIFRNQGIYIFVGTMIISLLFFWRYKKSIFITLVSVLVLSGLYNGPISKALGGIEANPLREMMSIPCVQLSRVALQSSDSITEDELNLIKTYIPNYEIYKYNSGISDAMKGCLDTERLKDNPLEFIKLWVRVGLKCPIDYFDAFARLTVGYWYPDMNYKDTQAYHPYWEYYPTGVLEHYDPEVFLLLKQTPVKGFEKLNDFYYKLTYENSYQKIPVLSILFSSALPLWCVLIYIAYCILEKQYVFLIPAIFVSLLIFTLLLGPVVLYRYLYPLCITVPLLLASAMNISAKT